VGGRPLGRHRRPAGRRRILHSTAAIDDYPHFAEHAQQHLTEPGVDDVGGFEFELDLILDGLQRIRDST